MNPHSQEQRLTQVVATKLAKALLREDSAESCATMDLDNDVNCSLFNASQATTLALVRGGAGIATFIANMAALLLIIFYQAVGTVLQRLFLYLTISSLGVSLGFSLEMEHVRYYHKRHKGEGELCRAVGFIVQYTEWVELLITFGITLYLLGSICHKTRRGAYQELAGSSQHLPRCQILLEVFFVTFCVVFPAAINWVPFLDHTYGQAGPWCWIKSIRTDCTEKLEGFWEQVGLWYIPFLLIGGLSFAVIITMTVTFCYWACRFGEAHTIRKLVFRGVLLVVAFIIFLVMSSVEVGLRFDDHFRGTYEHYAWWVGYAVLTPLSMFLIPFAFLAYLYSVDKLKMENIQEAGRKWKKDLTHCFGCRDKSGEHGSRLEDASAKPSDRKSTRSTSHFTPEHDTTSCVECPSTLEQEQ